MISMQGCENSLIAKKQLSKDKKYDNNSTFKKDSQNIFEGDISSIVYKLSVQSLPKLYASTLNTSNKMYPKCLSNFKVRQRIGKLQTIKAPRADYQIRDAEVQRAQEHLQKEIRLSIRKFKQPIKAKCSIYQQYLSLCQETTDYLEYCFSHNFGQQLLQSTDPQTRTAEFLKESGQTIILFVLKKRYQQSFEGNVEDIMHRILLAFSLNPLNDFELVPWHKFSKIRNFLSGDFSRKNMIQFLVNYFYQPVQSKPKAYTTHIGRTKPFDVKEKHRKHRDYPLSTNLQEKMSESQFWAIFSAPFRKLEGAVGPNHLDRLLSRLHNFGETHIVPSDTLLIKCKFQEILRKHPMSVWHQFVTLIFL